MAIVYLHKRLDTNEVFYVGIGLGEKRAYQKKFRNQHWKNIVKKHGYVVDVINKDITWEDACKIEIELISKYKRKCDGGSLCNITIGGDGVVGVSWSEDHKKKISEGNRGKTRTEEQRKNISVGRTGIVFSEEHRRKISENRTGKKLPLEVRQKMSNSRKKPVLDLATGIVYSCLQEACESTCENIYYHKYRITRPKTDRRFVYKTA